MVFEGRLVNGIKVIKVTKAGCMVFPVTSSKAAKDSRMAETGSQALILLLVDLQEKIQFVKASHQTHEGFSAKEPKVRQEIQSILNSETRSDPKGFGG